MPDLTEDASTVPVGETATTSDTGSVVEPEPELRTPTDPRWRLGDVARVHPDDGRLFENIWLCAYDPFPWRRIAGDDPGHPDPVYGDADMPAWLVFVRSGDDGA